MLYKYSHSQYNLMKLIFNFHPNLDTLATIEVRLVSTELFLELLPLRN